MRTRTLITGAAFLAVGYAGVSTAYALPELRGSDTLENVTEQVVAACQTALGLGSPVNIVYVGGGSGAGQSAMAGAAPTQHVAPMSRQLNGGQCTANSRQLLIGLDGLSILAKNSTGGAPAACTDDIGGAPLVLTGVPAQFVPCTSNTQCTALGTTCDTARQFCIPGGSLASCTAAQGCSPAGTYTFDNLTPTNAADDWQDVIRQIYGGMSHDSTIACTSNADCPNDPANLTIFTCNTTLGRCVSANLIHDPAEVNGDGTAICFASAGGAARNCKRNRAHVDCSNPVRGVLLASYGQVIRNPLCTSSSPACQKIKHAFRRDDLSGTTDAFQAIVGLVALAPPTTLRSTAGGAFAPEVADFASTSSPFCNAGTSAMNKGFSDGVDLDPYRRACSAGPVAQNAPAFESVCQGYQAINNSDVSCYAAGVRPDNYPQRERTAQQGRGLLPGGSVDTLAVFQAETRAATTRPRCLGVVQAISIPQDLPGSTIWATHRYPQGGPCTLGQTVFVNPLPARQILCPDGSIKGTGGLCLMPVNTSNGRVDCLSDFGTPNVTPADGGPAIFDRRVWNLTPVNSAGNMAQLLDSYQNPNFPNVNQIRRFARRYYGVNMARPDATQAPATIATGCQFETDTQQIGCLVKANPCSIGFAGREAADAGPAFANLALRINNIISNTANIENLATGGTPVYPLARKLWFNSFQDPIIGFTSPNLTVDEVNLSTCMGLPGACTVDADCTGLPPGGPGLPPCNTSTGRCTTGLNATVNAAISAENYVPVPAGIPRLIRHPTTGNGCPLP
jgi:hypothetical protein